MSAFVVSRHHIDALLTAGLYHVPRYPGDSGGRVSWFAAQATEYEPTLEWYEAHHRELTQETAHAVGRMLWWENVRSVGYRYPDGELPGPVGLTTGEVEAYVFNNLSGYPDPVDVLSLIACYEYQSCEHPDWHTSEAAAFCDGLRRYTIRRLPGYDDAPWGADSPDVFLELEAERAGRLSA